MANRKSYIWRSAYSDVFAVDRNFFEIYGRLQQTELLLKICYNCLRKSSWDSEEVDGRAAAVNVNSRYGGLFFENGHHDGYSIRKSVLIVVGMTGLKRISNPHPPTGIGMGILSNTHRLNLAGIGMPTTTSNYLCNRYYCAS